MNVTAIYMNDTNDQTNLIEYILMNKEKVLNLSVSDNLFSIID